MSLEKVLLQIYDAASNEMREPTQEDVDFLQVAVQLLGAERELIRLMGERLPEHSQSPGWIKERTEKYRKCCQVMRGEV